MRIQKLPDPISIREAASKNYVDNFFNDCSIIKNTAHIDLIDRIITNARFIPVNQMPQIDSHFTAKLYVDCAINEASLARNNQGNDFSNHNLTNINSITLNTKAVNDNQVINKAYVDHFDQENERSRRDLGTDFYDESSDLLKNNQDNDLNDMKLINLDSVFINRIPTSDNEFSNKNFIDDELNKNTNVRFSRTLSNYLKVSVGNDLYNLAKNGETQIMDATIIKSPNTGGFLLQSSNIKCNDKNGAGKIQNFMRLTKTNSSSSKSGATSLPPVGDSSMYIETSSNNRGPIVFVSWERTDIIQITNITFYQNRYSIWLTII